MPQKTCLVEALIRDPGTGEVLSNQMANGTTEDDGATVVIPAGYCPDIASVPAADIKVTVYQPPVEHQPVGFLTRSEDTENALSTLTFDLNPA